MRSLFVASAGGHLEELYLLSNRLSGAPREITWATWDTSQSRSLLAGEARVVLDYAPPRNVRATVANGRLAHRILSTGDFDEVVTTGALPAVPFVAVARTMGLSCHFIESAARVGSLSRSGQLMEAIPGVRRYHQSPGWSKPRWHYRGSVFDGFRPGPERRRAVQSAVVSVGSSAYGFGSLVAAARRVLPEGCDTLWQTGSTDVSGIGIAAVRMIGNEDFQDALAAADVVICHAGVGSALASFRAGRCPILVPRSAARGEHVDDHQAAIAAELERRGLAICADVGTLDLATIERAAARTTVASDEQGSYLLEPGGPVPDGVTRCERGERSQSRLRDAA